MHVWVVEIGHAYGASGLLWKIVTPVRSKAEAIAEIRKAKAVWKARNRPRYFRARRYTPTTEK